MTETSYAPVPAGWYPDPRGTKQRRWWDGNSWTHALETPPEPVAPSTPAYANLPGPQVRRTPSPSAPTVRRALEPESQASEQASRVSAAASEGTQSTIQGTKSTIQGTAPAKALPTRRQLRDAAAVLEAQRQLIEPTSQSPVYAMGPAASTTQQPQAAPQPRASFSVEQFSQVAETPAEQYTKEPTAVAKSPAISTADALSARPVSASNTFVPVSAAPSLMASTAASPTGSPAVSPAAASAVSPAAAAAVSPAAASAASVSLSGGPAYQPFGMSPRITTGTMEAPTSVNTSSVWLITVLPAFALAIAIVLIRFAPEFYTPFTQGALAFVFAIGGVALAVRDRRQLTLRSHQSTASPAWILLTPLVYLIARAANTKRQAGRGWMPAVVFVLLTAGSAAIVYFSGLPLETFVVV